MKRLSLEFLQNQIYLDLADHAQIRDLFKGYLHYKTIFCHEVACDVQFMNFVNKGKNDVLFSRYLDFCVFVKSTDFKICDTIINITA